MFDIVVPSDGRNGQVENTNIYTSPGLARMHGVVLMNEFSISLGGRCSDPILAHDRSYSSPRTKMVNYN